MLVADLSGGFPALDVGSPARVYVRPGGEHYPSRRLYAVAIANGRHPLDTTGRFAGYANAPRQHAADCFGIPLDVPITLRRTFTYDAENRLTVERARHTGTPAIYDTTTTYTYDNAGNLSSRAVADSLPSGSTVTTNFTYDADNRMTQQAVVGGLTTDFTYDKNGSMQARTPSSGPATSYTWDGAGRMLSQAIASGPTTTFTYDGDGVRTSKTTSGVTTSYVNDARGLAQVLQETKSSNTKSYVPGVAEYDPSGATSALQWAYVHSDGQNQRVLTDSSRWRASVALLQCIEWGCVRGCVVCECLVQQARPSLKIPGG